MQENNKIIIVKENGEEIINPDNIEGLELNIKGKNNSITIYEPYKFHGGRITLTGDIEITILSGCQAGAGFSIQKTRNVKKNKLLIGKDFQCGSRCIIDLTDAGDVLIGDDAKWSWNVYLKSDDTHPIFDVKTQKCLNQSTEIIIGNHVWICMNVTILKNSIIKEQSVIGACSVVAKKFDEGNVIIAGNPAQICKRNINWQHGSIDGYINKYEKAIT